jgi:hypothetical protein
VNGRLRDRRRVVAVALVAAVVVAGTALAFRHRDADPVASPESNRYVWETADCGRGTFTMEFDPAHGAAVSQGGQTLATASLTDRRITCSAPIQQHKTTPDESPFTGDLDRRSYKATTFTCSTDAALEIVVNPIWEGSEIVGSTLLVVERDAKTSIASAIFKRDPRDGHNWSRTYWDADLCTPSEP